MGRLLHYCGTCMAAFSNSFLCIGAAYVARISSNSPIFLLAMRKYCLIICLFAVVPAAAQTFGVKGWAITISYDHRQLGTARNSFDYAAGHSRSLYAEIGGPSGFLSFNYDWRWQKTQNGIGSRIGIGTFFDPYSIGFSLPVAVNYLFGSHVHFFELAGGASFFHFKEKNQDGWFDFSKENFVAPFVWAGYRYQAAASRFVFRAGLTEFFNRPMPEYLRLPFPSLSFGYSLR